MARPVPAHADELAVIAPDERFGGGGQAQTQAFVEGARALGLRPRVLAVPHPRFDGRRVALDRVETVRLLTGSRRLVPSVRTAARAWVVSTGAAQGYAAALADRPYRCWLGTSLADEWHGRRAALGLPRRLAFELNTPFLRVLERRVLDGAERIYATSAWSRRTIATAASIDERSLPILPIPVDIERFTPAAEREWLRCAEQPILVFVGRADDPRKNIPLLLAAFAEVRRAVPEAQLALVGAPPRTPLPDGVEVRGFVDDVPAQLRTASLFVLPSYQEGFGIAVAEALACGIPAVVTPCGGPESLVRDSGGGVVLESFDVEELATVLVRLLGDVGTLLEMRRRGRRHVENEHSRGRFRALLAEALRDDDD